MRFAGGIFSGCALALTGAWALALAFAGSTDVFFYLAPALLIVAPLLAGRYPGEDLIERFVAERDRHPRRYAPSFRRIPGAPAIWLPRGAGLLAFSLAKRPPPASLAPVC